MIYGVCERMYGSKHLSVSTHTAVRIDESVSQIVHAASICDRVANSDNNCSCLRPKLEEVQTCVRKVSVRPSSLSPNPFMPDAYVRSYRGME
jgi:hypothetical protein